MGERRREERILGGTGGGYGEWEGRRVKGRIGEGGVQRVYAKYIQIYSFLNCLFVIAVLPIEISLSVTTSLYM